MMDSLIQDLRFSARMLWNNPNFAAVTLVTLAIGVGGVTAVFSIVNGVLLRPLPYGEPERLVTVRSFVPGSSGMPPVPPSPLPPDADWRTRSRVFREILQYSSDDVTLLNGESPEQLNASSVTTNFTDALQVEPLMGRTFEPDDASDGSASVAIVSYGFWRNRLGGSHDAIGEELRTDKGVLTVIGIMPATFSFPPVRSDPDDLWVPAILRSGTSIARLDAGVSIESASHELTSLFEVLRSEYPRVGDSEVQVTSLKESATGAGSERLLILLFGAVTSVLLIAIANVVNLSLAHGTGREREMAIRSAVGSTRSRLVRQLLVENLLLSLLGGALGLGMAYLGLQLIVSELPAGFPRVQEIGIDAHVLGFTLATICLTALAFGILPALDLSKPVLDRILKEGGGGFTEPARHRRFRSALTAGQAALATVLVIGGLLFARSFVQLINTPLGMDIRNVVVVTPAFSSSKYPSAVARIAFLSDLRDRLLLKPDVISASISSKSSVTSTVVLPVWIEGQSREQISMHYTLEGSPEFFQVLRIPLQSGRSFRDSEDAVVITENFARRYFGEREALGQQVFVSSRARGLTIVGVAQDFRQAGVARESAPTVVRRPGLFSRSLLVRTSGQGQEGAMLEIRGEIAALDAEMVVNLKTLEQSLNASLPVAQPRFRMVVLGSFATIAFFLALVGIYGVASYSASKQTREIAIRLALGSSQIEIVGMIVRRTMAPVLVGIASGIIVAMSTTRVITSYLYETSPTDPVSFTATVLLLVSATFVATWIPLRKIALQDLAMSLRSE